MLKIAFLIVSSVIIGLSSTVAQTADSMVVDEQMARPVDTISTGECLDSAGFIKPAALQTPVSPPQRRHPWRAAAEVAGINGGLLLFDRYVLDGAYSHVTLHTLRRNLRLNHWFWDSNLFYTNLVEHPYQGNMFYNAARSNGLNGLESSVLTLAGDLVWEVMGENELPSVNDAIATFAGGIAISAIP